MPQIEITEVTGGADLDAVRDLCRAFRRGQYERYADQFERIDRHYREEDFEETLAGLAALHAPPGGVILLAKRDAVPAGCVMLSRVEAETCEMKRMFVDPSVRRCGVGRAMAETLIAVARERGYARMRLDTGPKQTEAVALYRALGFSDCEPYVEDGPSWQDKVYMDIRL